MPEADWADDELAEDWAEDFAEDDLLASSWADDRDEEDRPVPLRPVDVLRADWLPEVLCPERPLSDVSSDGVLFAELLSERALLDELLVELLLCVSIEE